MELKITAAIASACKILTHYYVAQTGEPQTCEYNKVFRFPNFLCSGLTKIDPNTPPIGRKAAVSDHNVFKVASLKFSFKNNHYF